MSFVRISFIAAATSDTTTMAAGFDSGSIISYINSIEYAGCAVAVTSNAANVAFMAYVEYVGCEDENEKVNEITI